MVPLILYFKIHETKHGVRTQVVAALGRSGSWRERAEEGCQQTGSALSVGGGGGEVVHFVDKFIKQDTHDVCASWSCHMLIKNNKRAQDARVSEPRPGAGKREWGLGHTRRHSP